MARTFGAKRHGGWNNLTAAARSLGGLATAKRRRAAAMAKLKNLSPIEIFRMGYRAGWKQGVRSARRRMGVAA